MKFTEGRFDWGYGARGKSRSTRARRLDDCGGTLSRLGQILVMDAIADNFLQQILTRADEFDVVATLNLNGDYISDALAAQVGGIGIAPGGNMQLHDWHAIFEATHGTGAEVCRLGRGGTGQRVMLSGEMMLRHLGVARRRRTW